MLATPFPNISEEDLEGWHIEYITKHGQHGEPHSGLWDLRTCLKVSSPTPDPVGLLAICTLFSFWIQKNDTTSWSLPGLQGGVGADSGATQSQLVWAARR